MFIIDLTVDHIIPIGDTKVHIIPHLQLNICDESVCLDLVNIIELRDYLNKFIQLDLANGVKEKPSIFDPNIKTR